MTLSFNDPNWQKDPAVCVLFWLWAILGCGIVGGLVCISLLVCGYL